MRKNENKQPKGRLYNNLILFAIVPTVVLCIIIMIFTSHNVKRIIYDEVENNLSGIASSVESYLETAFPGDYRKFGVDNLVFFKGEEILNDQFDFIDRINEKTGVTISLFYGDIRILTTAVDEDGNRLIGAGVNKIISGQVFGDEKPHFFNNAKIGNERYAAYYRPVFNADGTCMGMIGVAEDMGKVNRIVMEAVIPIIVITVIIGVVVAYICVRYAGSVAEALKKLKLFMTEVSEGNLDEEPDSSLKTRNDEIKDMALAAGNMQSSLRKMVDCDHLTGLYNRRYFEKHYYAIHGKALSTGKSFVVCMCDIDFFKKVNDTYGHDAGDLVLKNVAGVLKRKMSRKGFVARWGGEEFLLCFSDMQGDDARNYCEEILDEIRQMNSSYLGQNIKITMSFGIADITEGNPDELIKIADSRLYYSKEHGRNQVVYHVEDN